VVHPEGLRPDFVGMLNFISCMIAFSAHVGEIVVYSDQH
jgi:hypothetical protein